MNEEQGRRATDVEPAVQLFVQQELAETRHALRADIAALGTKVELLVQTSTREHAEVKAALTLILAANLEPRVAALEKKDAEESAAAEAVAKLGRQQRWIAGFAISAIPVALLLAPHIH